MTAGVQTHRQTGGQQHRTRDRVHGDTVAGGAGAVVVQAEGAGHAFQRARSAMRRRESVQLKTLEPAQVGDLASMREDDAVNDHASRTMSTAYTRP